MFIDSAKTITDPVPGLESAGLTDNADGTYDSAEIHINANTKRFYFKGGAASNLEDNGSGVSGQALYSYFKYAWKTYNSLTKFDFPMLSITNEQFEFINGWRPDDTTTVTHNNQGSGGESTTTRKMIRTAGWSEVTAAGSVGRRYAGIITLGTLVDNTDQPYFIQGTSLTEATTNTEYTGPVNEAVQIFGDTGVDATSPINTTLTSTFKLFVRERGKTYADSNLTDIGVSTMTYIVYRFPVSNATDLNINTTADGAIAGATISNITGNGTTITVDTVGDPHGLLVGDAVTISGTTGYNGDYTVASVTDADTFTITDPTNAGVENAGTAQGTAYATIDLEYLAGNILGTVSDTTYSVDDVVQEDNGAGSRWFICTGAGTVTGSTSVPQGSWGGTATWSAYTGEREVETGTYSAYNVILDANNAAALPGATKEEVYEWSQYQLRQASTIDIGTSRNGNIADSLTFFVGSTLNTNDGVFVDDIASADVNNIDFYDYAGVVHRYPLVVGVTINFNNNLSDDADSRFYAYYKTGEGAQTGNDFGTNTAIQVVDSDTNNVGSPISNNIPDGATGSSYSFNYAYDGDTANGRTPGNPVDIVVVAIGLSSGQYVKAEGTINASGGTVSLVAPLERNYSNP